MLLDFRYTPWNYQKTSYFLLSGDLEIGLMNWVNWTIWYSHKIMEFTNNKTYLYYWFYGSLTF